VPEAEAAAALVFVGAGSFERGGLAPLGCVCLGLCSGHALHRRCPLSPGGVRVGWCAALCSPGWGVWSGRCRASERAVRTFFPDAEKKVFCLFLILLSAFLSWLLSLALPRLPRQPLRLQAHQHTAPDRRASEKRESLNDVREISNYGISRPPHATRTAPATTLHAPRHA
jgi:hypothetical protein